MTNRTTTRHGFAELLQAELVGDDQPVAAVFDHLVGDFGQQSPVVVVTSAGSKRQRVARGTSRNTCYLDVHIFVLYADPAGSYTEAEAENLRDLIEARIAEIIDSHQRAEAWQAIDYTDRSTVAPVTIGGDEYTHELIPLEFSVF